MTARTGNAKYGVTILSTQNGTKVQSKVPVSSHPLFPAIVALWFGALFGLGSLAVRASLIESLVISSHIDVLVPMAAPPLGMTARILLALFMAMIGIAAGAAIAHSIVLGQNNHLFSMICQNFVTSLQLSVQSNFSASD